MSVLLTDVTTDVTYSVTLAGDNVNFHKMDDEKVAIFVCAASKIV